MQKKCFVVSPFSSSFDGIWECVIKPVVEEIGDECLRADDIFKPGSIINDIFNQICISDYIIADLSGQNPNVYYELGYAHALKKTVIMIIRDISELPFDLKNQRVILYTDTAKGADVLRSTLKKYLLTI